MNLPSLRRSRMLSVTGDLRTFLSGLHKFDNLRVVGLQPFRSIDDPDVDTDLPSFLRRIGHEGHPKLVFIPAREFSEEDWESWLGGRETSWESWLGGRENFWEMAERTLQAQTRG
jgi:hypothetical protein